jgi:hypothetical protein
MRVASLFERIVADPTRLYARCCLAQSPLSRNPLGYSRTHPEFASALQQDRAHRPVLIAIATRASETLRPPQAEQVVPARLLGRKPSLKIAQVPRVFLHSPPYYRLCQPESSK